jgi:hypothetical protein
MNSVSIGVLLLLAGALALVALPQADVGPGLIIGAAAANPPVRHQEAGQETREDAQGRRVRVVLASPYGPHTEKARELPKPEEKAVDPTVVSALPERQDAPAFAKDPSDHPVRVTPAAPRSRRFANPERSRHEKAKPSTLAHTNTVPEQPRLARGGQAGYRIAAIDERP